MVDKILDYCFNVSKQPVLLKDLLIANRQFNEKLQVDNIRLGYRLRIGKAYKVYILLISIIAIPVAAILHKLFASIDTHVSIVASIIFTALIFIYFNLFRVWIKDKMAQKVIQKAWKIHFPYFPYDEYNVKIEEIFESAMRDEISKKDLEKYILDKLVESD